MLQLIILIWSGSTTGNVQQRYLNYMDSFSNPTAFSARPTASVPEAELIVHDISCHMAFVIECQKCHFMALYDKFQMT